MAAMQIEPSHDVDRDFVDMMVPHHSAAIDMAEAELRYGHNEQTRRIAQEIIVTQQEEVDGYPLNATKDMWNPRLGLERDPHAQVPVHRIANRRHP
jgi:hypothetical protein